MRTRFLILILALVGGLAAFSIFRMSQFFSTDKKVMLQAQVRNQVGTLALAMSAEVRSLQELLKTSRDSTHKTLSPRFLMQAGVVQNEKQEWVLDQPLFQEGSEIKSWVGAYATLAFQKIPPSSISVENSNLYLLLDPNRKIYYLIVVRDEQGWRAGLVDQSLFRKTFESLKDSNSVFLSVNREGQTMAHQTSEYVASVLSEDPLVQKILSSEASSGNQWLGPPANPLLGTFEQVPQTNLIVIARTSLSSLMAAQDDFKFQLLLFAGGLLLVGAAVLFLFFKEPEVPIAPKPALAVPAAPVSAVKNSSDLSAERLKAYSTAASSLAHELRGPILSLLGRAQLLEEQLKDSPASFELQKMEEAAREASSTLGKLLTFAGEKEENAVEVSVVEIWKRLLAANEIRLQAQKISVKTQFSDTPLIWGQLHLLQKAFEQILNNSLEALERVPSKNLEISVRGRAEGVEVTVQDSGEGIEQKDLDQVLNPFFSTRSRAKHSGLGLSLALGVLRIHQGDIQIQSVPRSGTTVVMTLKGVDKTSLSEKKANFAAAQRLEVSAPPPAAPLFPPKPPPPPPRAPEALPSVLDDRRLRETLDVIDQTEDDGAPRSTPPSFQPPPLPTLDQKIDAPKVSLDRPKTPPPRRKNPFLQTSVPVRKPGSLS